MCLAPTPLLLTGDAEQKRQEIRSYFQETWDTYESLFETLKDDSVFYQRPEPLRHPLIFYFGHTATFFANKLVVSKLLDRRISPVIESMMAIGVDEMSWDDLDETHYDWPSVSEVRQYRNEVRAIVENLIDTLPLTLPIDWDSPFWIILMGIEHERIHLETSSVLIRQLPLCSVKPHPDWKHHSHITSVVPNNTLIQVNGDILKQGRRRPSSTYGWDNEYGEITTEVADFKASQFLVSNQEFLSFVKDGGYTTEAYWTEEGWNWVQYKNTTQPPFWVPHNNTFRYRTMLEVIDMPWSWPVDVNYLEAKAFCNWLTSKTGKPIRLPSEPEWYQLANTSLTFDDAGRLTSPANISLKSPSSCPVNTFQHGDFYDVMGNVWQWTETAIDALDGFNVHPAYDDFSVPTFDGRHNLIKGGSWIATGNEAILQSRYAFRRHFIQHAGFRYVESPHAITQVFNTYETDEQISEYLEFHYGAEYFGVKNFPQACIDTLFKTTGDLTFKKALDLGCAVGRSSFELARHIPHVDALDFSTRFIRNALNLIEHGNVRYLITDEGELTQLKQASLEDFNLTDTIPRVHFTQGDAINLKEIYTGYDLIFAGNLIERLYDPASFLSQIHHRLTPGGILVLTSSYTWDEEYTEKKNWLGGYKVNGENRSSYDALQDILKTHFHEFSPPVEIPYVVRETSRKHQHNIAQMTFWKRKHP